MREFTWSHLDGAVHMDETGTGQEDRITHDVTIIPRPNHHRCTDCSLPIENKVGRKEHEEAPFVALANITQSSYLPSKAAQAGTRNQHAHLRHVTGTIKHTQSTTTSVNMQASSWVRVSAAAASYYWWLGKSL